MRIRPLPAGRRRGPQPSHAPLAGLAALIVLAGLAVAAPAGAAEVTKTLRAELPATTGPFAVENLAGIMKVVPGTGTNVVAIVTVHAESQELADTMRFEKVAGDDGVPTLRVRYPLHSHATLRYPRRGDSTIIDRMIGSGSSTSTEYDDHRVKVTDNRGVLLYADVEVQVPKTDVGAKFRNVVGTIEGQKVQGNLEFDSGSGDIVLTALKGSIVADTGSGDVKADHIEGSLDCDTGSGNCTLSNVKGESIDCDVGSGDVTVRASVVDRVSADTGSGDVHVLDVDLEEFEANTGSGDVELKTSGARLTRIVADTGSGDVTLRQGPAASFEARAAQGSGDLVVRYEDAQPIVRQREVVGYRRGNARIRIDVDTGSGDVLITPGS